MDSPDWAKVVVYPATEAGVTNVLAEAAGADIAVKASGVGVFDDILLDGIMTRARPGAIRIFWDVDAPRHAGGHHCRPRPHTPPPHPRSRLRLHLRRRPACHRRLRTARRKKLCPHLQRA